MKFKTQLEKQPKHTELASCVGWSSPDELFSGGDDHQLFRWNLLNNETVSLAKLPEDVFPTDMDWFPKAPGASKKGGLDLFVLCTTDGNF